MSGGYREYRYWSPMMGKEAARISVSDGRNQEFFMLIPADERGFAYRERRAEAVEAILKAIEAGQEPGEVTAE